MFSFILNFHLNNSYPKLYSLHQTQQAFRTALCDSFNTPDALARLVELVSRTNVYLSRGRASVNIGVVRNVAAWVTKMLRMFGLAEGSAVNAGPGYIGWGSASADDSASLDVSLANMHGIFGACTDRWALFEFSGKRFSCPT